MAKIHTYSQWVGLIALLFLFGCGKENGSKEPGFDRTAMLENYASNLIQPAYQQLLIRCETLQAAYDSFSSDPSLSNLQLMQDKWLETAIAWQSANAYNFGPAGEEGLRKMLVDEIGVFPVDTQKVENYITTGDLSLANADRDSRGLLSIEYLLFGTTGTPQNVLIQLQADNRRNYLGAIIEHFRQAVSTVVDDWQLYKTSFVQNAGTDVSSSTAQLYNEFVRSFESIKNFKVGIPAGKRAGQTQAEPHLVEAYYSGASLELLKAHVEAVERIYYGTGLDGVDSLGFHEYLLSVEGGPELVQETEAQWQAVKTALNNVPTNASFSQVIENQDLTVDILHIELLKHTRFFKSDMSSLLGIAITFSSIDGD